jgi:hypothetical protein
MNKKYLKIFILSILFIGIGYFVFPNKAQAQLISPVTETLVKLTEGTIVGKVAKNAVTETLNYISYTVLTISATFVSMAGIFLSFSIKLTLNIKELYETSGSIKNIWVTVRDLSSIFIIFILLYESIKMILGLKGQGFNETVVKIFIAGMLINFSLVIFKIPIDFSNLASIQFYNAITPGTSQTLNLDSAFNDGGLSNAYMQSMQVWTVFSKLNLNTASASAAITSTTVAGFVMMLMAGFSFLAAAVAFTIRTGLLLFILVLSPLYFAGIIFPEIEKKVSKRLMEGLINQCVFMPVYLFLTYISLKIITDTSYISYFNQIQGDKNFGSLLALVMRFSVAFIFVNAPLVIAIELGGYGMKWAPGGKEFGNFFKNIGLGITGALGRNTLGRVGRLAGEQFDNIAANSQSSKFGRGASKALRLVGVSQAVRGGLTSMEKGKYGSKQSLGDVEKEDKARAKEVAGIGKLNRQLGVIESIRNIDPNKAVQKDDIEKFAKTISEMSSKDIENLSMELLKNPIIASAIPVSKWDSLVKSDNLNVDEVDEIKKARKDGMNKIYNEHGADYLITKHLKMKASEIAKLSESILTKKDVSILLSADTLKKIQEEEMKQADRDIIRSNIEAEYRKLSATGSVPKQLEKAFGYLTNGSGSTLF